jgi:hypothetical protein
MIYLESKASDLLFQNLHKNVNLKVKGYFKENNFWIAFDNTSGNCNVEEFEKEEYAIGWLCNIFEISNKNEFNIFKIVRHVYYIKELGLLKISKLNSNLIKTKLIRFRKF